MRLNFTPQDSIGADVYLHGHPYLVQQEWSNAVHTCAIDLCTVGSGSGVCPPQVTGVETVDNDHPVIGDTIHYKVSINNGSDTGAATNLTVNGPLPNGYQVTALSAPGATSQSSTATSFTVGYDTLAVHQTRTITVTATVPTQVGQSASACASITPQNLLGAAQPAVATSPCASTTPQKIPTAITYTGPTTADYHDGFPASATVTGNGPVSGGAVTFSLGGAPCGPATTDGSGVASCGLTPVDAAGGYTLHADYPGDATHEASSTTASFTITREETALAYTGPKHVANGVPATLSGVLSEDGTTPIAGRTVEIAIGTGTDRQACSAATGPNGTVTCTIPVLNQPLNATATLPVSVGFTGDPFYLPSNAAATVRLEYYTGRSFGLSASINLLLGSLTVPPSPDTGPIRVAKASTTTTPCTANVSLLLLLSADALCANVTTSLAPGTSTATATVANASIGLAGLPVIGVSGLTANSVSTCTGTSGSTTLTLTIGGVPVTVPTAPNSVIGLPGGARLVVNEQ
ncbi:MAG TPA: choice-of-anchor P family protein, partial [Pseudonocardiaceae bacterium]